MTLTKMEQFNLRVNNLSGTTSKTKRLIIHLNDWLYDDYSFNFCTMFGSIGLFLNEVPIGYIRSDILYLRVTEKEKVKLRPFLGRMLIIKGQRKNPHEVKYPNHFSLTIDPFGREIINIIKELSFSDDRPQFLDPKGLSKESKLRKNTFLTRNEAKYLKNININSYQQLKRTPIVVIYKKLLSFLPDTYRITFLKKIYAAQKGIHYSFITNEDIAYLQTIINNSERNLLTY